MVDTGFNLENLLGSQTRQVDVVTRRQEKEVQTQAKAALLTQSAAAESRVVSQTASNSLQESNNRRLEILGGIDEELNRAQTAIKLSQSDNPLDRLQLWALQQTSKSYTREGNQARIGYYTTAADALGYTEEIKQSGYADKLSQIQADLSNNMLVDNADLEMLKLMEVQGDELIALQINNQSNARTAIEQNQALQGAALEGLTDEQLTAAVEVARMSPDGSTSVSGVPITAQALKVQQDARTERTFLTTQRNLTLDAYAVDTLMMPELDKAIVEAQNHPEGLAVIKGRPVPMARLVERQATLQAQDATQIANSLAKTQALRTQDRMIQERVIRTFTPQYMNTLIANGGIDPETQEVYDIDLLQTMRQSKLEAQVSTMQEDVMIQGLTSPVQPAAQFTQELGTIKAAPGTPLQQFIEQQGPRNAYAASLLNDPDPVKKQFGLELINAGRTSLNEQVKAEAERLSMGDSKKAMALEYQLRGQPIPPTLIREALMDAKSGAKPKPVANWLPREIATVFEQVYQDQMRSMNDVTNSENALNPMSVADKKSYATEMATEAAIGRAMAPITTEFAAFQVAQPNNPLHGTVTGPEFLTLNAEADRLGASAYQQASGTSNEDLATLMAQGGNMDLDAFQYAHLLMLLEEKKPGLAESYKDWWQSDSRKQTTAAFDQWKQSTGNTDFQSNAAWGLAREQLDSQFERTSTLFQEGYNTLMAQELRKSHAAYITFGGDVRLQQGFMLQNTPTLNDSERSAAMSQIIQPLIQETKERQMAESDAAAYIERQLMTMQPVDATQGALLRKIRAERERALSVMNSFYAMTDYRNIGASGQLNPLGQLFNAIPFTRGIPLAAETNTYKWLADTPQ